MNKKRNKKNKQKKQTKKNNYYKASLDLVIHKAYRCAESSINHEQIPKNLNIIYIHQFKADRS